MKVRFQPSVDDYLYISSKISTVDYDRSFGQYAYNTFLIINTIGFPGFLIYSGHALAGVVVFGVNLGLYLFGIAGINEKLQKKYYERVMLAVEDAPVEVELSPDGITRSCGGDTSTIAWKNISEIEEGEASIYFLFQGGAVAVRKSGFAGEAEKNSFVRLAEQYRNAAN